MQTTPTTDRLLSWRRVQPMLGDISRSTIFRMQQRDPTFPRSVSLGARRIAWRESEVQAWIEAQAAKTAR